MAFPEAAVLGLGQIYDFDPSIGRRIMDKTGSCTAGRLLFPRASE